MSELKMKFKDAPKGARFKLLNGRLKDSTFVKIHDYGMGLIVEWHGNVEGYQSHCCWVDEEAGYNMETLILIVD